MIHKKITSSLFAFKIAACSIQAAPATAIAKDAKLEQQVEATLSKMTLEEKIGQMTELAIDVLGGFVDGEFQLDEAKLRKAIAEYKVGSFLNAPGPVAQDKDKWQEIFMFQCRLFSFAILVGDIEGRRKYILVIGVPAFYERALGQGVSDFLFTFALCFAGIRTSVSIHIAGFIY